ncbi:MAG: chromosomal replication initiator protein DnaA [Candidatus Promineifilaceae bacterium]
MSPQEAWLMALAELKLQMEPGGFNTHLKNAVLISAENNIFTISVQSASARDWLQRRMYGMVKRTLVDILGAAPELIFVVASNEPVPNYETTTIQEEFSEEFSTETAPPRKSITAGLNPRYTFSTFIVGHNSRLAHAAALAVAERPGEAYNPLFIYGGVGLGKTHLLHAVGYKALENGLSVCYISSETFTNDLIQSIRQQKTAEFREKYRSPDVLLIDDIQFIAGKESTQEELFHTFNVLHSSGKQVILSSDRPPRAMVTLEERLKSRFEWGLMADIQLPDQETRIAILQSKAEERNATVPRNVLNLIAHHVRSNIRELEGALNKVLAYAEFTGVTISNDLVHLALSDYIRHPNKVTIEQVISAVCVYYSVAPEKMLGKTRSRSIAYPRQIAMYLCRTETDASFPQIGQRLGKRNHTTIMHGHEKIAAKVDTDFNLRRDILEIKAALYDSSYVN